MNHHRPLVLLGALAAAFVSGALIAVQVRINGQLGAELGDGFLAALISFSVGTVVLGLALTVWGPGRRGFGRVLGALRERRMSPWFLAAGAAGATMVLSQGLTGAVIGVALFTVAVVGGQALGSLLLDRRGVGTMAARPFTAPRVAGAVLAVVAVVWAVSERIRTDIPWWMLVLPFVAGLVTAWQQVANGQVRERAGSVLTATFLSFTGGTIVLLVAAGVHVALAGPPAPLPSSPVLYLGGLLGVMFVAASAALIRVTGALLFGLASVAGQLLMAVVLDLAAPTSDAVVPFSTVGGAALALVAVVVASLRRRAASAGPAPASAPAEPTP